ACKAHMQQLKALERQGKRGEGEEEVTLDKNKPIPLNYESERVVGEQSVEEAARGDGEGGGRG
ncbi:hypothetical protein L873DRAFT_1808463, partial [Choiromyces venosus 120613-1]